ncbi:protein TEX261 [Culicoides brevitarsis]|uniref:protein TEX261 n=1 Tax=Culicoides brevitarsis TaxID=469753 RepID=UPI00307B4C58
MFLYFLSYLSLLLQVSFITLSIAAGLYYLAELTEEYTVVAKKIIKCLTIFTCVVYVLLMLFEDLSWSIIIFGLAAQAAHFLILAEFPFVQFVSVPFLGAVTLWLLNHYLAFSFFRASYYPLSEMLAYFTICLWTVPFALFVSLGANDNVLPMQNERQRFNDNDVVTNYLSSKKKVGLLSLFQYAKETFLPGSGKKIF